MSASSPLLTPRQGLALPSSQIRRSQIDSDARPSIKTVNGVLNLGKIGEARIDLIPQLDECNPGLRPTEYNVIVAPARASKTLGSGALHAPDEYIETAEMAMQVGRIVSMSPLAFNYDNSWPEGTKPKIGDIVWYARYAGALIECAFDGQMYRMVKDKDVAAIIDQPSDIAAQREAIAKMSEAPQGFEEWRDGKVWETEPT